MLHSLLLFVIGAILLGGALRCVAEPSYPVALPLRGLTAFMFYPTATSEVSSTPVICLPRWHGYLQKDDLAALVFSGLAETPTGLPLPGITTHQVSCCMLPFLSFFFWLILPAV